MTNPQIAAAAQQRVKRYGQWSVQGEKLRITYKDSEESVLFEDTASISYLKISNANPLYIIGGFILGFILGFGNTDSGNIAIFLLFGPIILGVILGFSNKIKYDNVAVETRGGKIIRFTVDSGYGKTTMEQIEEDKRKWEMNKK